MLCSRIRGSRARSIALADVRIIDSHTSPSMTSGSAPLIRADPSRRMVPASGTPGPIRLPETTAPSAGSLAAIADHFTRPVYRGPVTFTPPRPVGVPPRFRSVIPPLPLPHDATPAHPSGSALAANTASSPTADRSHGPAGARPSSASAGPRVFAWRSGEGQPRFGRDAPLPLVGLVRLVRAGVGRPCGTPAVRVAGPGVAVPWPRIPRRCPGWRIRHVPRTGGRCCRAGRGI